MTDKTFTLEKDSNRMKRNPIAIDLHTQKYRPRVVNPKKGKGSYSRKKISA